MLNKSLTNTDVGLRDQRPQPRPRWAAAIFDRGRFSRLTRTLPLLLAAAAAAALPARAQTDTTPPRITSFELDPSSTNATTAQIVVTFSEPVTGVDASDFALNTTLAAAGSITSVTPGLTAASYRVGFNYSGASGSVQMAIKTNGTGIADLAGNAFVGGGMTATLPYPVNNAPPPDMTLPGVTSFTAPAAIGASPVQLTLVFGKTVTGVSSDDFIASNGATIGTVTGSGTTWTVPVSFTGTTPVTVTLVGGATANIRDTAGHWYPGSVTSPAVTFTPAATGGAVTAPVISSPLTASVTVGSPFSYTLTGSNSPATLTATGLPSGLTYTSPTISGTVATPGIYTINLGASNTAGSDTKTLTLTVNPTAGAPVRVLSVTPPPNGSYTQGQTITFAVTFSAPVTVTGITNEDSRPYFTWTAASSSGAPATGRVRYVSGSGSSVLTFSYRVEGNDVAPNGIQLGSSLQLPAGVTLRDASGATLSGSALNLVWTTNPLTGVVFRSSSGNDDAGKGQGPVTVLHGNLQPGQPFTLPATTPSGQRITWILVSGNATLNGNVVTPTNRGAVVLRAVVAGTTTSAIEFNGNTDDDSKGPGKAHRDRLSNLSSRLRVSSDDPARSAIAGFVVTGVAPKQVLLRAVGPGLSQYNVSEAASAVRLQLHDPSGRVMASNDGWNGNPALAAAAERVGAFKLNADSRDSALLVTLPPGAYTCQVAGSSNGIALIEVYDAASAAEASTEQLINISTRGPVDVGQGNLIAGFIVTGEEPKRVLIRGVGPGLARYNVAGVVPDPVLELVTAGGAMVLARNDNWELPEQAMNGLATAAEVSAAARATGAFPLDAGSKDSAILVTLMPGAYSAVMRSANGATGIGLVEVYEVP